MIRITDITLSCLGEFHPSDEQLRRLYRLLGTAGADTIEMPASVYERLRPIAPERIILRISQPAEKEDYPEIGRFVCRKTGFDFSDVMPEIQLNDVREINFLGRVKARDVRLVGLDDILFHDFENAFEQIGRRLKGRVEFCPENSYSCATAAAIEWLAAGGSAVAASFGGLGGKASLEEVLLALRVARRHKPNASFSVFPKIAALVEEITSVPFSGRKPVIGRDIFSVESGIHIDGIMKRPQMYEPFFPEIVGRSRLFVVGKHSGRKSIAAKLSERGYMAADFDVVRILKDVHEESVAKQSSLSDDEFFSIAQRHRLSMGGPP